MKQAARDWLPARESPGLEVRDLVLEWIDWEALSGERFLRLSSRSHTGSLSFPVFREGPGVLSFEVRSRQQIAGTLQLGDAVMDLKPTTEWGKFTLKGETGPEGSAQILITLLGSGAWELRSLRFRDFAFSEWQGFVRERTAKGLPRNLLPFSRFPLGLPPGWTVNRESSLGDSLKLFGDPSVPGLSSCPSLHVSAEGSGWLRSPPVYAWPSLGDTPLLHRASIRLRGEGEGSLNLLAGTRCLGRKPFVARTGWTSVDLQVGVVPEEVPLILEISWKGPTEGLWLDSPQISPVGAPGGGGETMPSVVGREAAELALQASEPEAVYFDDAPFQVLWHAEGAPAGGVLCWVVSDLYGRETSGEISLEGLQSKRVCEDWTLSLDWTRGFGSYRLNAWIEGTAPGASRSPLSPVAEIILHRLPRPRFGDKPAPSSCFGVHVLPTAQHLALARAVGMKWVRLHGPGSEINYWFHLEPEPGTWHPRPDLLQRYRKEGFSVLGKLTSAPRWASGQSEVVHTYFDQFVAPKNPRDWYHYVRRVIDTYGAAVDVYEIWNEPWLNKFFSQQVRRGQDGSHVFIPLENPVGAYAELTRLACLAAQESMNKPQLVGLNTTTNRGVADWIDGADWTQKALAEGALDEVEIVSYHDYEQASGVIAQYDKTLDNFAYALGPLLDGRDSPRPGIWNTEGSAQPEGLSAGLYRWLLPECPDLTAVIWEEAERQARYVLAQRVAGVQKIFLYTMHNSMGFGADNSFSVILAPDGSLHPVGAAFAVLAHWLDQRDFIRKKPLSAESLPLGRLLTFGSGERPEVEVLLCDADPGTVFPLVEAGEEAWHDLWGNPVSREVRRGNTFFRCVPAE